MHRPTENAPLAARKDAYGVRAILHRPEGRGLTHMQINARTDEFFKAPADTHDERLLDATLARARAYAAAGADGLFVPGLRSPALIRALTAASPLPVNVMRVTETPTLAEFAAYGVARISHGPYPYLQAMKTLAEMVRQGS
ncbi:isocitrate lyase/phosphoenolpyruvate mutase family protein [Burkholderia sp. AU30198]|uniref:isocitrate lyase/phosphoenolpyruvate mutase family protein n=1 Tax=Burkholderia sp. AU30198 TaxID=2879627 RepID=UPI0039A44DF7